MTKQVNIPRPTSASSYRRKKKPFLVQASPDLTVLVKPVEMAEAFFGNLSPMPATAVRAKFEEMQKRLESGDTQAISAVFSESEDDSEFNMLSFLRRYVCAAVVEPKIVMEDDGNPEHIPVTELSRLELLNIWNADPAEKEPPVMDPERVEEFRGSEPEQDDPAPHARKDVRPETKLVDAGDREIITA
jgi:hypothetical protein